MKILALLVVTVVCSFLTYSILYGPSGIKKESVIERVSGKTERKVETLVVHASDNEGNIIYSKTFCGNQICPLSPNYTSEEAGANFTIQAGGRTYEVVPGSEIIYLSDGSSFYKIYD